MKNSSVSNKYIESNAAKELLSELFTAGIKFQALLIPLSQRQKLYNLANQLEPLLILDRETDTVEINHKLQEIKTNFRLLYSEVEHSNESNVTVEQQKMLLISQFTEKNNLLLDLTAARELIQKKLNGVREQLSIIRTDGAKNTIVNPDIYLMEKKVSADFFQLRKDISKIDEHIRVVTFFGLDVWDSLRNTEEQR